MNFMIRWAIVFACSSFNAHAMELSLTGPMPLGLPRVVNVTTSRTLDMATIKQACLTEQTSHNCLLMLAAQYGFIDGVEETIRNGALLTLRDEKDRTALHLAARFGRQNIVALLLQRGVAVDIRRNYSLFWGTGITPLHEAVHGGHDTVVALLIAQGASINAKTEKGMTPLLIAVKRKWADIARILLEKGADLTLKDADGRDALAWALMRGESLCLDLLFARIDEAVLIKRIESYVTTNKISAGKMLTLLELAVKHWYKKFGNFLLQKSYEFFAVEDRHLLIPFALRTGNKEILKKLFLDEDLVEALVRTGNGDSLLARVRLSKIAPEKGWKDIVALLNSGNREIIDLFLNKSSRGDLLLKEAIETGKTKEAQLLLSLEKVHLENVVAPAYWRYETFVLDKLYQKIAGIKNTITLLKRLDSINQFKTYFAQKFLGGNLRRAALGTLAHHVRAHATKDILTALQSTNPAYTDVVLVGWAGLAKNSDILDGLLPSPADLSKNGAAYQTLCLAALQGNTDLVKLLIEQETVNASKKDDGFLALYAAALSGKSELFQLIMNKLVDARILVGDKGVKVLCAATFAGNTQTVGSLLSLQCCMQVPGDSLTPLHAAVLGGNFDIVAMLLAKKVDVSAKIKYGITALHVAAFAGNQKLVEKLCYHDADVLCSADLGFAVYQSPLGVCESGMDMFGKTDKGFTVLHAALLSGNRQLVEFLLAKYFAVAIRHDRGSIALAILLNDKEMVRFLIEKNVDVTKPLVYDLTGLHLAALFGDRDLVGLLLDKGAQLNAVFDLDRLVNVTALHCAALVGNQGVVELLLEKGAVVSDGVLHAAAFGGNKEMFHFLLSKGAPLETPLDQKAATLLEIAAGGGNSDIVQFLLERDALRTSGPHPALLWATRINNREMVERLLARGASLAMKGVDGRSALFVAAEHGHKELFDFYRGQGAVFDGETWDRLTLLHAAVMGGNKEIVRAVLAQGVESNARDGEQKTPLDWAIEHSDREVIALLLEADRKQRGTAIQDVGYMYRALEQSNREVVQDLLAAGFDPNIKGPDGWHPLIWKAHHDKEIVKLLLTKIVDSNFKNSVGETLLHWAVIKNDKALVELLFKQGARATVTNDQGDTPLHYAAKSDASMLEMLLNGGSAINAKNRKGETPLIIALEEHNGDAVHLLLKHGADPNMVSAHKLSALHIAILKGDKDSIKLLLENRANVNIDFANGDTGLHRVVMLGDAEIVKLFLQAGASVNERNNKDGTSPLQIAIEQENADIVQLLLAHNADRDIAVGTVWDRFENRKKTLLDVAAIKGNKAIIELLLSTQEVKRWNELRTVLFWGIDTKNLDIIEFVLERADIEKFWYGPDKVPAIALAVSDFKVFEFLISKGINVNQKSKNGWTAFVLAAVAGSTETIDLLFAKGADIHATIIEQGIAFNALDLIALAKNDLPKDIIGARKKVIRKLLLLGLDTKFPIMGTASKLVWAMQESYTDAVSALLARGEDTEILVDGFTPLQLAVANNNKEVAELLIQAGANTNGRGKDGVVALHFAAALEDSYMLELLLSHGASPNVRDKVDVLSALQFAAKSGKVKNMEILLACGAKIDHFNALLHLAVENNRIEVVKFLLNRGANINARDTMVGMSVLHKAVEANYRLMTEFLLSNGANIHSKNNLGETALHIAAIKAHIDIIELLLSQGADIQARTIDGWFGGGETPLHYAASADRVKVVQYLISQGADAHAITTQGWVLGGKTALDVATGSAKNYLMLKEEKK